MTKKMKKMLTKDIKGAAIAIIILISIVSVTVKSMAISNETTLINEINISQGYVSVKEVSLNTKIPGRIVEFYIEEGNEVSKGDPLVKISSDELEAKKMQLVAQVAQADAGMDAAEAVIEMAKSNYNLSLERIEQAKAGLSASESQKDMASAVNSKAINGARTQQISQAESAYTLWESTYNRANLLFEGGALSLQKLEEIKTQKDLAKQTLDMANEGARTEDKAAAYAQLSMANAGVSSSQALLNQAIEASNVALAQITQAQAGLVASQGLKDQAQAGLLEVEAYLKDTLICAPIDGTITALNSDEGELVSTGTSIGTISNLDTCWVTINMDENRLGDIIEGQKVKVRLAAYEGKEFDGRITTISTQPNFAVKKATNENGNFDIVSFAVKIILDSHDEAMHPGMTAIVDFEN